MRSWIAQSSAGQIIQVERWNHGRKETGQEPTAMKDPETGELLVSGKEIKKATQKYCVNNLKNKPVSEWVREIVKLKENLHTQIEDEWDTRNEFIIEIEDFKDVNEFESKNTKSYDFLIKAGEGYKEAIGRLHQDDPWRKLSWGI